MNFKVKCLMASVIVGLQLNAANVLAKATEEEVARLGKDLTCFGSEKAGNKDGTIPEFSGKWQGVPPHVDFKGVGHHPPDPYADEEPLFFISASNMQEYADRLSDGEKALLKKYPETFRMPIYKSHRDFRFADQFCENAKRNAATAELIDDGLGVANASGAPYFPFPKSGLELVWDVIVAARANSEITVYDNAYVLPSGEINWGRVSMLSLSPPSRLEYSGVPDDDAAYYLNHTLLPTRDKGEVNTGIQYINYAKKPRQTWRYDPGTRRVRQSPGYGFDMSLPGTGGSMTVDEAKGFNGSPERYDWKIVAKNKEIYIPANAYRVNAPTVKYADLLTPNHANPKFMRYELHRVWVLEGTLKSGFRHLYGKRVIYVDADTLTAVLADNYDARGELWRTTLMGHIYAYEARTWYGAATFYHDLQSGTYTGFNLVNERPESYILNSGKVTPQMFGPEAARRMGK